MIGTVFRRALDFLRAQRSWDQYRDYVRVHPSAIIDPRASVRIFNPPDRPRVCLEIGEGCHVFSQFSILRPNASIRVGARCQLGVSQFIAAQRIDIGDDVIMAWDITVIDSDNHSLYWSERQFDVERCRQDYAAIGGADIARNHDWSKVGIAPVKIGDKCWIGLGGTILKGVTLGEGAVIGARSVVTRDVKPWHVAAGNPCREIRPLPRARGGA